MDQKTLVRPNIEEGKKLLGLLDRTEFSPKAALWLQQPENGDWQLIFASRYVDRHGPTASYALILRALQQTKEAPDISITSITALSLRDHLIQALYSVIGPNMQSLDLPLTHVVVDDLFIEAAYIYRLLPTDVPRVGLLFENLDQRTRRLMLDELDADVAHEQLYLSPYLSSSGKRDFEKLLRQALREGDELTLADALRTEERMDLTEVRKSGMRAAGVRSATSAADLLAESEFKFYYYRAMARRALEDGISNLEVYRAKAVGIPRPTSHSPVGTKVSAQKLLDDLRSCPREGADLKLAIGLNAGMSVRLP